MPEILTFRVIQLTEPNVTLRHCRLVNAGTTGLQKDK